MLMQKYKISENSINLNAKNVCKILQNTGHQAFIVGGCVRDLLLQNQPKDWDITTSAKPEEVMHLFPKHYATGLKHGTITVCMGEGLENQFEVTTFRIEGKYNDGRRPEQVFFVKNIEEDLSRRDLTINAIAYDPISETLVDPFGGQQDIENKIIKAVGNPLERFQEDGLRIMRAARFATHFNYNIEQTTKNAMSNSIETLQKVSMERIRDEFCKILMTNDPYYGISILQEVNAFTYVCPILNNDYLNHFLPNLNACNGQLETRVASLYFNVQTKFIEPELIRLKFSNKEIKKILFYSKLIGLIQQNCKAVFQPSLSIYIKVMVMIKNETTEWKDLLKEFIILTKTNYPDIAKMLETHKDVVVLARREMNINGDDLLALGVPPGKEIGLLIDKCYQMILENSENNTKEKLIELCNEERKFIRSKI